MRAHLSGLWLLCGFLTLSANAQDWEVFDLSNSPLPSTTVNALVDDGSGGIWVGTDWGLCHFDGSDGWEVFQVDNSGISSNFIKALDLDSEGNVWIGTQIDGLVKWDGAEWTSYTTANSPIPENEIRDLFVDHRDWVWMSTAGGLGVYTGTEWYRYDDTDESHAGLILNTSSTNCVAVREDGLVGLGTVNGGFHFLTEDDVFFLTIQQDGFFDNTATDVLFDPLNGDRWVATPSAGLLRQQGPAFGGSWFQWGPAIAFPTNSIARIAIDQEHRIWAASLSIGVIQVATDGSWVVLDEANSGLPDNELRSIEVTASGDVWVGSTYGGIAKYNRTVGYPELTDTPEMVVYPNPSNGYTHVRMDRFSEPTAWRLFDLSGSLAVQGVMASGSSWLDLSEQAPGAYILVLGDGPDAPRVRVVLY